MSYIVPRDIPRTCVECNFSRPIKVFNDEIPCDLEGIYVKAHEKYAFCPLVEVRNDPLFSRGYAEKYLRENPPKGLIMGREVTE